MGGPGNLAGLGTLGKEQPWCVFLFCKCSTENNSHVRHCHILTVQNATAVCVADHMGLPASRVTQISSSTS